MRLFLLFILATTVFAFPQQSEVTSQCAVCHFAIQVFSRAKQGTTDVQASIEKYCLRIKGCPATLSHCEIIDGLSEVQLAHNTSSVSTSAASQLKIQISKLQEQCRQNPHMNVLDQNQPGAVQCTMCFLIYYFFQYISTAVLEMPLLGEVAQVINLTCIIVSGLEKFQPAICIALLGADSLPAIIRGIQDSLGSFYWLIGEQGLGCLPPQQLFSNC